MKRLRRRYLAVKIDCKGEIDGKKVVDTVLSSILKLFGQYGASKTGLTQIDYDEKKGVVILRCFHTALDMVRAAVCAVTEIDRKPVAFHVIDVSGSIKTLKKRLSGRKLVWS